MKTIMITNASYKKKILKQYEKKLCPIKFYTWQEFLEKYYFSYRSDTLYYVTNTYHVDPSIAQIYLDNLYFIEDKEYTSSKLNFLVSLKKDLEEHQYLQKDISFKSFLKESQIIFYGIPFTPFHEKIKQELETIFQVKVENDKPISKEIPFITYENTEEEVIGVLEEITILLKKGVDSKQIKILPLSSDYQNTIQKISSLFSIPYESTNVPSIYTLDITQKFLEEVDKTKTLKELLPYLEKYQNTIIYDTIAKIFSNYTWVDIKMSDFYMTFIYLLKQEKIPVPFYKNAIQQINDLTLSFTNEYVFILGATIETFPKIIQDNNFLSEEEMITLGLGTIEKQNQIEEEKLLSFLDRVPHVSISFAPTSIFQKYSKPTFLEKLKTKYPVVEQIGKYRYTNEKMNKLYLGKYLDIYDKFSTKEEMLSPLLEKYGSSSYRSYQNRFTGITPTKLHDIIKGKLNLSYSNMDTFFKCAFRFYLDSILKLKPFEETVSTKIGKIFHRTLEIIYREKRKDYEVVIDTVLQEFNQGQTLNKKDIFYQKKYKESLLTLIQLLNEQLEKTNYQNTYFEQYFSIEKDKDLHLSLVGFIDKILTLQDEENTYVVVIDYKTGVLHNDFNKAIYGMDMQLLVYLYLIKHTDIISNPKFTGMYLQPILSDPLKSEKNKQYIDLIRSYLRLDGYTSSDWKILKDWDKGYEEKSFIKGLKVKKDNSFYSYSKVLTEEEIEKLLDIVDENINRVLAAIKTGFFPINPKRMDNKNVSCEYCPYSDICYHQMQDLVTLPTIKKLEFLGDEEHDTTKA